MSNQFNPITGMVQGVNSVQSQAKPQSANNPYAGLDPKSSLSGLQKFLDFFGFTNYAGKVQSQLDLLSNQWESDYASKLEDREYNSEQSQIDRMRAAGINPDLNGVQSYESQTSGNAVSNVQYPAEVMAEPVESLANSIMSAFQFFVPMVQGFQQIRANKISNDKNYYDSVSTVAKSIYDDYLTTVKPNEKTGPDSWSVYVKSRAPMYSSLRNKKYRKDVISYLNQLESDFKEQAAGYANKSSMIKAQNDYVESSGKWFRNGDDLDMLNLFKSFSEFEHSVEYAQREYQKKSAQYSSEEINANINQGLPNIRAIESAQQSMLNADSAFFNRNNKIYQSEGKARKFKAEYDATISRSLERFFKSLDNVGLSFFIKMRMLSPGGVGDLPMDLIKLIPGL